MPGNSSTGIYLLLLSVGDQDEGNCNQLQSSTEQVRWVVYVLSAADIFCPLPEMLPVS